MFEFFSQILPSICFCNQCSKEFFGLRGDFEGKTTKEAELNGEYSLVWCEGCGLIYVNNAGDCISKSCEKHGKLEV